MDSADPTPRCDWDAITAETLNDDEALAALYGDACRLARWPNTDAGVIEFWAWAETVHSGVRKGELLATAFATSLHGYGWIAGGMTPSQKSAARTRMPDPKRAALVEAVDAEMGEAPAAEAKKSFAARKKADYSDSATTNWDEVREVLRSRRATAERAACLTPGSPPDINRIHGTDLEDNGRLAELFVLLVQHGELAATHDQALRCVMAAEIALERDKRDTPGALFRHTLRPASPERYFTAGMEQRARGRMSGDERHDMVAAALNAEPGEVAPAGRALARPVNAEEVRQALVGDAKLGFAHTLFLQCFLPHRAPPEGTREYVSPNNGSAWLAVTAGMALEEGGRPKRMEIPSGAFARILWPHFGRIVKRDKTPVVVLGARRAFMEDAGISYGGRSAQLLSQQLLNLLVAQYTLGTFEIKATAEQGTIRPVVFVEYAHLRRAIREGKATGAFWVPEFQLSQTFYEAFALHRAPVRIDHLRQLMRRPRAMDIYLFFCYRTRTAGDGTPISISILRDVFAPGMPLFRWRAMLRDHLQAIHDVWPFDVQLIGNDMLQLAEGEPPVPSTKKAA